ncbi:MAG TPA: citrate/2-methylcitrate synthase [Candidatus Obscuribacter sp.]|nr:citrate/2-methylcitrate synthase [Candidatus Obscuribacter sp.]
MNANANPNPDNTAKTFSPGLEGVTACRTRLSEVLGKEGKLILAGHNAVNLAENNTIEEVWFLLHEGRLPNPAELAAFKAKVEKLGVLPADEVNLIKKLRGPEPLSAFRTALSAISNKRGYKPWLNRPVEEVTEEVIALCALAPAIVEVLHTGRRPRVKTLNSGYAERYLWGVSGKKPSPEDLRAVETYLILTMDHGLNASTFASRVTASTGADVGAALTSGVATLSGPLHGGAPGPVLDMLDAIGTCENADTWVRAQLAAKIPLMGFGHRIYRTDDPRAMTLKRVAERQNGPRIELAKVTEQAALKALEEKQIQRAAAENKPVRTLRVNVEFWTAVALEHVGIPRNLFSSTFCVSRIIGWGEHIVEQIKDNKIYRPLSQYTGEMPAE